jgi:hypothetical protein
MNSYPAEVKTANYTLRLTGELGTGGGQGRIFRTTAPQVLVKLLKDTSPERRHRLEEQLQRLRWLGGEEDLAQLHLTRPGAILQPPHLGYLMELLTGMVPLGELLVPDNPEEVGAWYVNTGGLRRRLRLLARAAEILHGLHCRSLVYADPSPNNIFVSAALDAEEVWLIDVDNLHFESGPGPTVYTRFYAAPEVYARRSGVNTLTDAHAFAVIAFEVLILGHPLLGDTVSESALEVEEAALEGKWPYVDHSSDTRNACSTGLPREWVLWPPLLKLMRECFELGLNDPRRRPGMASWVRELHAAADTVLPCPAPTCGWGYNIHHERCPACQHPRPEFYLATVHHCLAAGEAPDPVALGGPSHRLVVAFGAPAQLTGRIVDLQVGPGSHERRLVLFVRDRQVRVKPLDGATYWLASPDSTQQRRLDGEQGVPWTTDGKSWLIHLGPPDRRHQVVRLRYFSGVTA